MLAGGRLRHSQALRLSSTSRLDRTAHARTPYPQRTQALEAGLSVEMREMSTHGQGREGLGTERYVQRGSGVSVLAHLHT